MPRRSWGESPVPRCFKAAEQTSPRRNCHTEEIFKCGFPAIPLCFAVHLHPLIPHTHRLAGTTPGNLTYSSSSTQPREVAVATPPRACAHWVEGPTTSGVKEERPVGYSLSLSLNLTRVVSRTLGTSVPVEPAGQAAGVQQPSWPSRL